MNTAALPTSMFAQWMHDFAIRWRFKFVLPRTRFATLEGVRLDISGLSTVMKNNVLQGRYETQERRMAAQHLTVKDSVLELGGAIGFISLYCQKILGIQHYTIVEPNPASVAMLKRNHALNHNKPEVIEAAAAGEDGELELHVGNEFWCNSLLANGGDTKTIKVQALSLRSLIARLDYQPTTLIADIEGAEQFLDFTELPASVTKIIIELHPDMIGDAAIQAIHRQLTSIGFAADSEHEGTFVFLR